MSCEAGECQVVEGIEEAPHCPALQEYVRFEEVVLYGRAREQFVRARLM